MSNQELTQPELADVHVDEDSEDLSRSEVILKGALAAGAVYGAVDGRALRQEGAGDVRRRRRRHPQLRPHPRVPRGDASTRKRRRRAKASGELKNLIDLIAEDEDEHVEALTATIKKLGGKPVAEPKFDFPYSDTAGFLKLAQTFEDTGVSAYNGAAPQIKSKEVLAAAGSIVQVEARHAAAIRLQNGEEPSPVAFDPALDQAKVLKAVEPFIQ